MLVTPRSYILLPGDFEEEFQNFVLDFKTSQALAVVKHVADNRHRCVRMTGKRDLRGARKACGDENFQRFVGNRVL